MDAVSSLDAPANSPIGEAAPVIAQEATAPLARYWQIVARWRWLIAASVVTAILIGAVITLSITPIYSAKATLEILREEAKVVDVKSVEPSTAMIDQEFYQTQYGLLRSRALAERVVRKLGLARDDRFIGLYDQAAGDAWFGGASALNAREQAARRERTAIALVLANQSVSPVRASRLVDISFSSPDPEISRQIVDTWSENFIASTLERRFEASAYARRFLEDRLREVRDRLETSERGAVDYATRERIINVAGPINADGRSSEQSLVSTDLAAINQALNSATAERVAAQSKLALGTNRVSSEQVGNEVIAGLRRQGAEASAELARLSSQFKADYPPMVALRSQLAQIDQLTRREERRIADSLRTGYENARQRETILQARVAELKGGYLDNRRRAIQYNIFQRDVDTNRTLYDGLLQRYKEIGIAGGVGTNNVSIVDRAVLPIKPTSPRPLVNLAIAALAGLFIGLILAFVRDQIDETVSSPEQLEAKLGTPMLGTVPLLKVGTVEEALTDRRSELSEAYFSVGTNLKFSTSHGVPRSLLITSSRPSEGKSTTAMSIARNLARLGRPVLLIDGDLRNPSLHRSLRLANRQGFSDALSGNDALATLIQSPDESNLRVMTSGPLPPNPAELLSVERLSQVIGMLLVDYGHVIIDGPPVLGLADAPLLGSHVESVVYVAEAHRTRLNVIRIALRRLLAARAHVLGVVITKFEPRRSSSGYGDDYGYAYSYRYGGKAIGEETEAATAR